MNKYLIPKLYGGIHGTVVAVHIAATSNIPKRRRKSNADVYLIGLALLGIAVAVVVWP